MKIFKINVANKHIITAATIAAIAIGFLISLQFQTQQEVDTAAQIQNQRLSQMKSVITTLQEKNKQLLEEQKWLNEEIKRTSEEGINNPFLIAKLDELRISDGTIHVQGPGIRMVIQDNIQNNRVTLPLNVDDLRNIINILRFSGAEAISINGQRIVTSTSIVMSGDSTILINSAPISRIGGTTYEILATGNQDKLVDYLTKMEASSLKQAGMKVDIFREIVTIPAYSGGYKYEYAQKVSE